MKEIFKEFGKLLTDDDSPMFDLLAGLFLIMFLGYLIGYLIRLLKPSINELDRYYFTNEYSYQGYYLMRDRHNPLLRLKLFIMDKGEYELYKVIYNHELKPIKQTEERK